MQMGELPLRGFARSEEGRGSKRGSFRCAGLLDGGMEEAAHGGASAARGCLMMGWRRLDKQESSLSDPAVRWMVSTSGMARSISFVAELLKVYIELNFPVGREDIRASQGLQRLAIILCLHVSFQQPEPKTLYLLSVPSPVIMTGNLTLLISELRCVCICCLTIVA